MKATKIIVPVLIDSVYRLRADPTSTLGVRLKARQVCFVEFEAFKLRMDSSTQTLLAQLKLIAKNESTSPLFFSRCVSGVCGS